MNTKQQSKIEMEKRLRRRQARQAKADQVVPLASLDALPPAQKVRGVYQEIEYLLHAVALLAHRIKAPLTEAQARKLEADSRRVRRELDRLEKLCRGGCTDEQLAAFDRGIAPLSERPKPDLANVVHLRG